MRSGGIRRVYSFSIRRSWFGFRPRVLPKTLLMVLTSLLLRAREKDCADCGYAYGDEVTGGVSRAVIFVRCEERLNVALRNRVAESLEH